MSNSISPIVFWLCMPTPHMEHFLAALSEKIDNQLYVVYEAHLASWRSACGFASESRLAHVSYLDGSDCDAVIDLHVSMNAIQVFGGFIGYPRLQEAMKLCRHRRVGYYVISETGDNYNRLDFGFNFARRVRQWALWRMHRSSCRGVFAIGRRSMRYFASVGVPRTVLHPFMYTVEPVYPVEESRGNYDSVNTRFVFLGRLVLQKGLTHLIDSLSGMRDKPWTLDVYGDGPEREHLEQQVARAQLSDRITFKGMIDNTRSVSVLAEYDLMIAPSVYDGWGAVINEAVNAGLPVACSDQMGGSDLVLFGGFGVLFPPKNSRATIAALIPLLNPEARKVLAQRCLTYRNRITPDAVAGYFLQTLSASTSVIPPWSANAGDVS